MNRESEMDVEIIQVEIPGKLYEEKLAQLAHALLSILENAETKVDNPKNSEAA